MDRGVWWVTVHGVGLPQGCRYWQLQSWELPTGGNPTGFLVRHGEDHGASRAAPGKSGLTAGSEEERVVALE